MSATGERPLSVWSAPSWGHPARWYRAWLDPELLARWMAPGAYTGHPG